MISVVDLLASAAQVLDTIFRAADKFTAGAEPHDDMTRLVMKLIHSASTN